ncbi:MAG: nickel-dependent hydrogenase large subunit [PVC group bacterium]|nr:nickel-dependent hydrogenase large subunit [PVC group bacterium]
MSKKIVIDPITRIEGHLGVEVEVENDKVIDARCKANMFRGFETILKGRDPRDAIHLTQRICGVCSCAHATASVLCVENAAGANIPENARIIRNLALGANYLHSHILHFYHLAALDFVQGPSVPPFIPRYTGDFRLPEKINAACVEHYLEALKIRMLAHEMRAMWTGKAPHHVGFMLGGVSEKPSVDKIAGYIWRLKKVKAFIDNIYIPDVLAVADVYKDYKEIGKGHGNLLAYGVFDLNKKGLKKLLGRGAYINNESIPLDPDKISEDLMYSWYKNESSRKNPKDGATDPMPDKENAYTWGKAARYDGKPCEVGPLARMWVNGDYQSGISVIDRHAARALEAKKIADVLEGWATELRLDESTYKAEKLPKENYGIGLTEAPRGALGHWVKVEKSKTANYQVITPTVWNVSPRDDAGVRGPIEEALIGTPVADADNPIEIARVVRSFDPCLACTVHLIKPSGEIKNFRVA